MRTRWRRLPNDTTVTGQPTLEILGIKEGQNPKLPASVEDLIDIEDYMTGDDLMYAGGDEKEAAKKAKRSAKKKAVIPKSK